LLAGPREAFGVLAVVVLAELAAADRFPPPAVVHVPLRGLRDGLSGIVLRFPAERAELVDVHAVAAVVAGAVRHVLHEAVVLAEGAQHDVHHFQVRHLASGADVVHFPDHALQEDRLDAGAVVVHVRVVTHLQAVTVHGQRLAQDGVRAEERHGLLRVLVRPDVVRAARDRHGDAVRDRVRLHQLIGGRLACRVRAARGKLVRLHALVVVLDVAVHLVGADVMQPDPELTCHLQQHVRAAHVRVREHQRSQNTLVHVRLRREVHDQVNALVLAGLAYQVLIADVPHHQRHVRGVPQVVQVFLASRVRQLVIHHDPALRMLCQPVPHEITPDKPTTARNEDIHLVSFIKSSLYCLNTDSLE